MKREHIPGFLNKIPVNPKVRWQDGLPTFEAKDGECLGLHVVKFQLHVARLGIDYPKDYLINMFMLTLEEMARMWYESRPPASISSIKDFYLALCKRFRKHHPSPELIEALCGDFEGLMLYLGLEVDDGAVISDETKEAPLHSDCQSSCSSLSVPEPCIQEEHVQEVVAMDTSEEQGCIEDHLAKEQEVAPFPLTNNRAELSHQPRYDESDDDSFEKPILDNSLGSDPIYYDSASYSENNEDINDSLSTSEWEVSHQNVAYLENTDMIIDMVNKEHK